MEGRAKGINGCLFFLLKSHDHMRTLAGQQFCGLSGFSNLQICCFTGGKYFF